MQLLDSLDEPGRYVVRERVPIFKPHKRRLPGGKEVSVTKADLAKIAEKINRLESDHGVVMRLTDGHVEPSLSEANQPSLFGYARRAVVGTFGPKDEPCILATLYFLPDQFERAKSYPYRSVEYYPQLGEIRGVALLKRDPFLDLGMVAYATPAGPCYRYSLSESAMPDDSKAKEPAADAAPAEPQGHKDWCANMDHYAKSNAWVKYAMDAAAGASAPTATNVAPPESMPSPGGDAARMQRDSDSIRYARLEEETKLLREQVATLVRERDTAECERYVTQLEAEGYSLRRPYEVAELLRRKPEERAAYIENVRVCYQRGPVGGLIQTYGGPVTPGVQPAASTISSESEYREFVAYCRDRGIVDHDRGMAEFSKSKGKA